MPKPSLAKFAGSPAAQAAAKITSKTKQASISSFFAPVSKPKTKPRADEPQPPPPATAASPPAPKSNAPAGPKKRARAVVIDSESDDEQDVVAPGKRVKDELPAAVDSPSEDAAGKGRGLKRRAAATAAQKKLGVAYEDDAGSDGATSDTECVPNAASRTASAKRRPRQEPPAMAPAAGSRVTPSRNKKPHTVKVVGPSGKDYTPLELQFMEIKAQHPDAILFVEVGYKYKFFGEDAEIAARELNIMCMPDKNFVAASIPVHRLHVHVKRLIELNYKVGIVRQTETAALKAAGGQKAGPFERQLTAMYTKGTFVADDLGEGGERAGAGGHDANYLMCVVENGDDIAFLAVHLETGDMVYDSFTDSPTRTELHTRIMHLQPSELLVPDTLSQRSQSAIRNIAVARDIRIERQPEELFDFNRAMETLSGYFGEVKSPMLHQAIHLPNQVVSTMGALLTYLKEFNLDRVFRLPTTRLSGFRGSGWMHINGKTMENLELMANQTDGKEQGSLIWVMDRTRTAFGKRLLRKWICKPLTDREQIVERLDAVSELRAGSPYAAVLQELMESLPDLERAATRAYYKKATPSEVLQLLTSVLEAVGTVSRAAQMRADATAQEGGLLTWVLGGDLGKLKNGAQELLEAMSEKAAKTGDKTALFTDRERFPKVMAVRDDIDSTLKRITSHRKEIREMLNMRELEYKSVAGQDYLVEVKNAMVNRVPRDWPRISGTKQVSRFRSPKLEQLVAELQRHRERLDLVSAAAWLEFLADFAALYDDVHALVVRLATLDSLMSLADISNEPGYCRPEFTDDPQPCVRVVQGRHPMVAAMLAEAYVPNDITLDSKERCAIITGPNMGGKSCLMRMVALLVIMAQIGSYLPADSATLGVFDGIYTRMGASDHIQRGMSTFMVELQDASEILRQATSQSLVILDELGRGTSTHDGVAVAYATASWLINNVRCITLFATHYPCLGQLELVFQGAACNYHMSFMQNDQLDTCDDDVEDAVENITFLYQLVRGAAKRSYGLNVARLADIPAPILRTATVKSRELERTITERSGLTNNTSLLLRSLLAGEETAIPQRLRETIMPQLRSRNVT